MEIESIYETLELQLQIHFFFFLVVPEHAFT